MKIKKFSEGKNIVLEEIHIEDQNSLLTMGRLIQQIIPSFDMRITGNYGVIKIDGITRFTTEGPDTVTTISTYISGLYQGLTYKK